MEDFLIHYGLAAVFIAVAIEGDVSMILTGVIAHMGLVRFPSAVVVGALAAAATDCAFYWVGRKRAERLRGTNLYRRIGPVIERLEQRLGSGEILIAHFVCGARLASMFFWGSRGLSFGRFLALDLAGCSAWAAALAGLGFAFSNSAERLIGRVKRAEIWLLIAMICAASMMIFVRQLGRRRHP